MLKLIRRPIGPGGRRRGVTLVEMLVVVALVVLMMVILVQIFQAATGAISASRTIQELDVTLRQVDSIIRSDLAGATACMNPSILPAQNDPDESKRGYFEYGENAFADAQGEDTDDYLAFTTRAPEGQVFSGRQWLGYSGSTTINQHIQATTINSPVAEVIYFLRNGNLYRRVFLVTPERASSLTSGGSNIRSQVSYGYYPPNLFGVLANSNDKVSWQGMNDISCRPGGIANISSLPANLPIPNNLGDLTNRENRAFRPRFLNDFAGGQAGGDGIPDDNNGDYNPDYYPTLYFDGSAGVYGSGSGPNRFTLDPAGNPLRVSPASYSIYAFPFIYPGMYSVPDTQRLAIAPNLGWVHGLNPASVTTNGTTSLVLNHAPLDVGDNLPTPAGVQTWWGFPTWRETMTGIRAATPLANGTQIPATVGWTDPIQFVGSNGPRVQPNGLIPYAPNGGLPMSINNGTNLLPPVTTAETNTPALFTVDSQGNTAGSYSFSLLPGNPSRVWEDDLLLTGVRSFDVKAYDPNAPLYNNAVNGLYSAGYYDLGYASANYTNYIGGPNGVGATTQTAVPWQAVGGEPVGFGHEGRIPPLPSDFRPHPRLGYNIGDPSPGVIRLARVWDSWSTDYTNAPDTDLFGNGFNTQGLAVYPSFPAPYPSPLRGIQIQVRLVDARGEKAKPLTIRVDFTDKLQ